MMCVIYERPCVRIVKRVTRCNSRGANACRIVTDSLRTSLIKQKQRQKRLLNTQMKTFTDEQCEGARSLRSFCTNEMSEISREDSH